MISVVMPVYNDCVEYVQLSIASILNQTYKDFELIIVDSSDAYSFQDEIEISDSRIRYFWVEKNGIANALNYGISKAFGEYIARMDADDIAISNRFEIELDYLKTHPTVMAIGGRGDIIDGTGTVVTAFARENVVCSIDRIVPKMFFENCFWHPTMMIRKVVFDKGLKYDPNHTAEDYDLWTRMLGKYEIVNIPEKLVQLRVDQNNTTFVLNDKVHYSVADSSKKFISNELGVDFSDFDDKCFLRSKKLILYNTEFMLSEYIISQGKLLSLIFASANNSQRCNGDELINSINRRWNFVFSILGNDDFKRVAGISDGTNRINTAFMSAISRLSNGESVECVFDDESVQLIQKTCKDYYKFLHGNYRFVLYGLGERGKRFLSVYNAILSKEHFNWELSAISDKKKNNIDDVKYVCPDEINSIQYDFILVSSNKYFEDIKTELVGHGIDSEKIFGIDTFLQYAR